MSNANLQYRTGEIAGFYSRHRRRWDEFYPSERWIFEAVAADPGGPDREAGGLGRVLDVGCAAGGLGAALGERFGLRGYTGIDINRQAVEAGRALGDLPSGAVLLAGDVMGCADLPDDALPDGAYDTVVSLSCADWNVETRGILDACWRKVAPGGRFVVSLRLTTGASLTRMEDSRQLIRFGDGDAVEEGGEEWAPYVVFNTGEALGLLGGFDPAPRAILGYGYWGKPSATARTRDAELLFAVFAVTKPGESKRDGSGPEGQGGDGPPLLTLRFPWSAWGRMP